MHHILFLTPLKALDIRGLLNVFQTWECEDRAKSPSLTLKRRKQSTKAKISLREIARRKGQTKEAKYDAANEISCRENCYSSTQRLTNFNWLVTVCGS